MLMFHNLVFEKNQFAWEFLLNLYGINPTNYEAIYCNAFLLDHHPQFIGATGTISGL